MKSIAFLYLPVMHRGYLVFVQSLPKNTQLYVIDESVIALIDTEFDYLRKEIRALTPFEALQTLRALLPEQEVSLIDIKKLKALSKQITSNPTAFGISLPAEDIFRWLSNTYFSTSTITWYTTFLRWDRHTSTQTYPVTEDSISSEDSAPFMAAATTQSLQSSDWWRQVGCVAVKDGKILATAHNHHLPTPYSPYMNGDPRNAFHKGEQIELSTAIHAEAQVIAECARSGISLENAELYVTTFPCPPCAKLVAHSGITKLYFKEGYAMLDGETVLKEKHVTIIRLIEQ
jgi:dCMP deaminase